VDTDALLLHLWSRFWTSEAVGVDIVLELTLLVEHLAEIGQFTVVFDVENALTLLEWILIPLHFDQTGEVLIMIAFG